MSRTKRPSADAGDDVALAAADGEGGLVDQGDRTAGLAEARHLAAKVHGSLTGRRYRTGVGHRMTWSERSRDTSALTRGTVAGRRDCHYGRSENLAATVDCRRDPAPRDRGPARGRRRHRDPARRRPGRRRGRGPRPHGPERLGQVDAGQHPARQPRLRGHRRPIRFQGEDVTAWPTDVRAKAGMFLAFQYPEEIPGVPVIQFLRQALSARKGIDLSVLEVRLAIMEWMKRLGMDPAFGDRYLNEGFSGGEKKRNEILQMAMLEPELAILDETDSGLDIDALRVVADGVQEVRERPARARRAAHHPLPAHPRRARSPTSCTSSSTAASSTSGGPELAAPARGRGLRGMADDRHRRADRADARRGRASRPTSRSSSARCTATASSTSTRPRRRRSPQRGARRHGRATTRPPTPTCTAASTPSPRRRPTATRRPGPRSAGFIGAAVARTRSSSPRTPPRPSTWSPTPGAGPTSGRATWCVLTEMEHHANIVPWLMLAEERGIELRCHPHRPTTYRLDLADLDRLLDGAKLRRLSPPCPTCSGTITPVRADRRGRPRRRRAGAGRRRPVASPTCPPTCRPLGCDFLGLHAATRCSAPPASGCCGAGASCSRRCRRSWAAAR